MRLELENGNIANCISVLDEMGLKGMKSINKTRLKNKLIDHLKRILNEERELKKELCHLDGEGEPRVKEDGSYDFKDKKEGVETLKEFYTEKVIIEGGDNLVMLKSVKQSLEESEVEWTDKADAYYNLYTGIKEGEDKDDA